MESNQNGKGLPELMNYLSVDPRANAVFLCSLQAIPDKYILKVRRRENILVMAGSRPDLPFKCLTFSFGDKDDYRSLIGDFRIVFSPGDEIYSILPEKFVKVLEQVVEIKSRHLETQLYRAPSVPSPKVTTAKAHEIRGFKFRMLEDDDLSAVQNLMDELGTFIAFSKDSLTRGVFYGAYDASNLVAIAGTHTVGTQYCEVGNVATREQYRRLGFARACLELLINELCQRNLVLFLFAWRRDFLIELYKTLGFGEPLPFELVTWEYPA
jgi:ribosomal protein S18 acetylase RimI-like enzyme